VHIKSGVGSSFDVVDLNRESKMDMSSGRSSAGSHHEQGGSIDCRSEAIGGDAAIQIDNDVRRAAVNPMTRPGL
jgi:hypothetical protein